MSRFKLSPRFAFGSLTILVLLTLMLATAWDTGEAQNRRGIKTARADGVPPGEAYRQANLVSDVPGMAFIEDDNLVNSWGISLSATSPFWVSNNETSTSTLYRSVAPFTTVTINPGLSSIDIPGDGPTGTVSNPTTDFVLPGPCGTPPCKANFIFASTTGNISGWNPNAPGPGSTTAVIAASQPGHVYLGLAIGSNASGNRLYAADFANGNIDVYNGTFGLTTTGGGFADPSIPNVPPDNVYHPFNIQNVGGMLYVMYAKVDPMTGEEDAGDGKGFVRRFTTDGFLDATFGIDGNPDPMNHVPLNAPWGVALAPASFGTFGGKLLIGNFGEGSPSINAFDPATGDFVDSLENDGGDEIEIDELWALTFGNGGNGGDPNVLYFTAGPAEEAHGLFGWLRPTTATAPSVLRFSQEDYVVNESGGTINITVTRTGDFSGPATVNYNALTEEPGPGHADSNDFILPPGTLNFAAGEQTKFFTVGITNDSTTEGDETLDLVLSNPTGDGMASPNIAELTIHELIVTAAEATVGGRVLTPYGQGLRNAVVTLRDEHGNLRETRTSSFGYFDFDHVHTGQTYVVAIRSKLYDFTPQSVTVVDDLTDLEFIGAER